MVAWNQEPYMADNSVRAKIIYYNGTHYTDPFLVEGARLCWGFL